MSDYFPNEILVEILHRQTLKSLVKCTTVCKSWNSLVTNPTFIFSHLNRTLNCNDNNANHLLLLRLCCKRVKDNLDRYIELYSLRLDNEGLDLVSLLGFPLQKEICNLYSRVVGTCNGLVCLADDTQRYNLNFIVWNPSVRKYVKLPRPHMSYSTHGGYDDCIGFGFDSRTNDFKVVRVVNLLDQRVYGVGPPEVEVYSLARGSWEFITATAPLCSIFPRAAQVFINGSTHWRVIRQGTDDNWDNFILSFNVADDVFQEISLPECLAGINHWFFDDRNNVSVLTNGELLGVVYRNFLDSSFDVWMMKEYGVVESWTKVFAYIPLAYNPESPTVLAFRENLEVLVQVYGELRSIDARTGLFKDLRIGEDGDSFMGYYVERLFLLNKVKGVMSY
ncbi:F-box protein [Quillaja saponaria]|uniref:F-box protein n=1 Tax=Quillaja saponaria TaxID=32244 RepID=A0AAD7VCT8_QUISA|nr:F-box protein [Quillaja saponaria]